MSSSFLIPQQCTKRFYNSVALFSKALLAPRSPGWASFVDKVPAKAGEDASFHKRGSVYTPPKMHIHTPHTCTHIPALCTHSQCTPPPRPLINMPTGTHTLRAHQPLPPHTPSSHTLYRRYTLPTHPHTPTFLTYTFHHINTPRTHTCHMALTRCTHTFTHTHKNLTVTRLPHPICPVHTQTGPHICHAHARKTPPQQQALPQQPMLKGVERRPGPSPGKSTSSCSQALLSALEGPVRLRGWFRAEPAGKACLPARCMLWGCRKS